MAQWWCALFVDQTDGAWQRAVAIKVRTLRECARYRSASARFRLTQAVLCETEARAAAFLRLWTQYPRVCRAPISFVAKAEVLAEKYGLAVFCDFNIVLDDTLSHFVASPPPPPRGGGGGGARAAGTPPAPGACMAAYFPPNASLLMERARRALTYPLQLQVYAHPSPPASPLADVLARAGAAPAGRGTHVRAPPRRREEEEDTR